MSTPTVETIHIVPSRGEPIVSVNEVRAIAGEGLEGDRYQTGEGRRPEKRGGKRAATLVEAEALEALERDYDLRLEPGETRRNITTRGVALNHLVGRTFRVGDATLKGYELCEPCGYLEGLTKEGVRAGLVHRGGLRAEIVESGAIRVGDTIEV